jgi:hypothetical protein
MDALDESVSSRQKRESAAGLLRSALCTEEVRKESR